MSTYIGEGIPLGPQQHPKAPDPRTERRSNNPPLRGVVAELKPDGKRIHGIMKESTVWDVYNNEARKVDNELVKDWTASLNLLLVFAAIFAAVLTAFIIESKRMLEPDNTEILLGLAMQYFNTMGNPSRNNFTRPVFEPTAAISVNCLLFASLGASLVAALASVVALQWVADYDAAIARGGSSPLDRAKRRQFRDAGVMRWKMGELIAALPLLLYSSVVLFWVGAIHWMWTLHHIVGYVVGQRARAPVPMFGSFQYLLLFFVDMHVALLANYRVLEPIGSVLVRGLQGTVMLDLFRYPASMIQGRGADLRLVTHISDRRLED